jgi:hypothetical protein
MAEDYLHNWLTLYCVDCGHNFVIPVPCKDRFCPICSKIRLSRIRRRLSALVKRQVQISPKSVRFLTLTISSTSDITSMVRTLQHSFRKLRQEKSWKKRVTGGASVIEITKGDHGWHAHIHAIICGRYFPFGKLLDLWQKNSPGRGVYLKFIPDTAVVNYLTKYITKPDSSLDDDDIISVNNALFRTRLFQPFGNWHGWYREIKLTNAPCPNCESTRGYLTSWDLNKLEATFEDVHEYHNNSPPNTCMQYTLVDSCYLDPF